MSLVPLTVPQKEKKKDLVMLQIMVTKLQIMETRQQNTMSNQAMPRKNKQHTKVIKMPPLLRILLLMTPLQIP